MNKCILIGRLTRDPELSYTTNQLAVARFSIALDRGKDKNGKEKGADFPRVIVFGKQAENCEKYLAKGRKVAIEGRIQTGNYDDKNGNKVYTTDIVADRIEFIDWGGNRQNNEYSGDYTSYSQPDSFEEVNDDVPF